MTTTPSVPRPSVRLYLLYHQVRTLKTTKNKNMPFSAYLAASVFPAPLSPVMMMLWSRFLRPATPPESLPAIGSVMKRCALSATAYTWGWSKTCREVVEARHGVV